MKYDAKRVPTSNKKKIDKQWQNSNETVNLQYHVPKNNHITSRKERNI